MISMGTEYTLAIDFGTSNSLVGAAQIENGKVHRIEPIPLDVGAPNPAIMRTLLYFANADNCFFGHKALSQFIENDLEGRLFRSFKTHLPNSNYLGTQVGSRVLTLESMIGIFILELKKRAENFLNTKITRAVFGKPARYSMDEVQDGYAVHRMEKAIQFAGFADFHLVPEPLAAALDFRRDQRSEKIVLIGDFGGGTSDFTIMKMSPRAFTKSDVLAVDGCPVAGDSLDSLFMKERLAMTFGSQVGYRLPMSENILRMPQSVGDRLNKPSQIVHLKEKESYHFLKEIQKCALSPSDRASLERLFVLIEDQQIYSFFEHIEKTKRTLSAEREALFEFEYPGLETQENFLRNEFENWANDIKLQMTQAIDRCLTQAQLQPQQIDYVVLTGGSAYVPFVREIFVHRFGKEKLEARDYFQSVVSGLIEAAKDF